MLSREQLERYIKITEQLKAKEAGILTEEEAAVQAAKARKVILGAKMPATSEELLKSLDVAAVRQGWENEFKAWIGKYEAMKFLGPKPQESWSESGVIAEEVFQKIKSLIPKILEEDTPPEPGPDERYKDIEGWGEW